MTNRQLDGCAIVIAHFHPKGSLRADLAALVCELARLAAPIVFVSTNLDESQRRFLPGNVLVIARENRGYDFYSYKVGIDALGELATLRRLVLFNSSFICLDRQKLIRRFFAVDHPHCDVFGLTRSQERQPHLQSFLLSFGARCLHSERFRRWWSQMLPIDDREGVIERYELGLSAYLAEAGFSLGCAYSPSLRDKRAAWWRAVRRLRPVLYPTQLNPTQFYWDVLLRDFGVAKLEMIEKNPYNLMDAGARAELSAAAAVAASSSTQC